MPHSHKSRKRPQEEKGVGFKILDLKEHMDSRTISIGTKFPDAVSNIPAFCEQLSPTGPLPKLESYHHSVLFTELDAWKDTKHNLELAELPKNLREIRSSVNHTQILDKNKRLLAYRYRVPLSLIKELETSASLLHAAKPRQAAPKKHNNAWRGPFSSRNYNYWNIYGDGNPFFSVDFLQDLPHSERFLQKNAALFERLSQDLQLIAPDVAFRFQSIAKEAAPLSQEHQAKFRSCNLSPPSRYRPLCGTFAGCAINNSMVPPVSESEPESSGCQLHRDKNDLASGLSALVPFGQFTGGNLILVELGMEIEVSLRPSHVTL